MHINIPFKLAQYLTNISNDTQVSVFQFLLLKINVICRKLNFFTFVKCISPKYKTISSGDKFYFNSTTFEN